MPGVIVAKPEIKSAEDLKGKVIGTGRAGALADTMVRYVLQGKMNLMPDRDVKLLPMGEPPSHCRRWNAASSMLRRFRGRRF